MLQVKIEVRLACFKRFTDLSYLLTNLLT